MNEVSSVVTIPGTGRALYWKLVALAASDFWAAMRRFHVESELATAALLARDGYGFGFIRVRAGGGLVSQQIGQHYSSIVSEVQIELLFVIFGTMAAQARHMAGYRFCA